jgi:hypothetical protein
MCGAGHDLEELALQVRVQGLHGVGQPVEQGEALHGYENGVGGPALEQGWKKPEFFLNKKTSPVGFLVFLVFFSFFLFFFGFFYIFAQKREFLGFFSFKNTFRCIETLNYLITLTNVPLSPNICIVYVLFVHLKSVSKRNVCTIFIKNKKNQENPKNTLSGFF